MERGLSVVKCKVCGVYSVEWSVEERVESQVWSVKCGVGNGKWELWSVKCRVYGVQSVECKVWSVKWGVWNAKSRV